jgi:hypothetical protein
MDLKHEQRRVYRAFGWATLICAVVLAGCHLSIPRIMTMPSGLAERIAFGLQADIFIFACVLVAMRMVSGTRLRSAADIRGSAYGPPSPALAVKAAFLQNTLEQAFMAIGTHLALATLLPGSSLGLIPGAVLLFIGGRIAFYHGYPGGAGGRAFGMIVTVLPTLLGIIAAIALIGAAAMGHRAV